MRELVSGSYITERIALIYVLASSVVSAQQLKHELDSSNINLKVCASLIRHTD